jgi:drug/metabolite transporter (DMT)-like permease
VTTVLLGILAGLLLGSVNVIARLAILRFPDPEFGGFVMALVAGVILLVIVAARGRGPVDPGTLWPYFVAGMIVPGASQVLWVKALRYAGPSRAAVAMGVLPLFSVAVAILALGEPFRAPLAVGTLLIVCGGITLVWERRRPADFRALGLTLAVIGALMQAGRDNTIRALAKGHSVDRLLAATTMVAGALVLLLVFVLVTRPHQLRLTLSPQVLVPWFPAGVCMAAIYITFLNGLGRGPVEVFVPLAGSNVLWTVVLAAAVFGRREAIGRHVILAAALVVGGGALIGIFR